jgi:internalin A
MSELALQLIAENKKTRATFLDLGNCGLTKVPEEIGELVWLEAIALSGGYGKKHDLSDLSPLANLSNLKELYVRYTKIADLSILNTLSNLRVLNAGDTLVTDLSPLANLACLETLIIDYTNIFDLSPLKNIRSLQRLVIDRTNVSDLSSLVGLRCLKALNISDTPVSDVSPLRELINIEEIYAHNTPLSDLSSLANLTKLKCLNISKTPVSDLSPLLPLIEKGLVIWWSSESWQREGIFVGDCPLKNPPPEIVQQGNAAILNYFKEIQPYGTDHLYEAKLLIVGEGKAGKTSLVRRLYQTDKDLPEEKDTTKGIDIHPHTFTCANGRVFRLNVWDFGGQEIYHATHQFFLTQRSLYVLLDDTRSNDKTVHDPSFKYWLDVVDLLSNHSPLLIFQNEKGGRSKAIDLAGQVLKPSLQMSKTVIKQGLRTKLSKQNTRHIIVTPARFFAFCSDTVFGC